MSSTSWFLALFLIGMQMLKWAGWLGAAPKRTDPSVDQFVGAKLRTLRIAFKESVDAVGAVLSVSAKEIKSMEAGKRRVSAAQLFVLAKYFDVPVAAFFDRREAML